MNDGLGLNQKPVLKILRPGEIMKKSPLILKNEKGSTLLVAILILLVLTLLGLAAMTTSVTDIHIAANEKAQKIAFYHSDSGVYALPKLISRIVNDSAAVKLSDEGWLHGTDDPGLAYSDGDGDTGDHFFRQIMGYDTYDNGWDVEFYLDGDTVKEVDLDVEKLRTVNIAGGGVEFASGAEGMGIGSVGGVGIIYGEDSLGQGPRSSQSNVYAEYRKVLGMPGGL
jgi:hypothetical protein